jgi:anti-anti-sigma regulatory factor
MLASKRSCRVEQLGDKLILTPRVDLGELDFAVFAAEVTPVARRLEQGRAANVAVDLRHTQLLGSEPVELLIKLRGLSRRNGGRMALCGVSQRQAEIVAVMKLGAGCHICSHRCPAVGVVCNRCPEFLDSCLCEADQNR